MSQRRQTMPTDKRNQQLVKKELDKFFRGKTAVWFKMYVDELVRRDARQKRPMLKRVSDDLVILR